MAKSAAPAMSPAAILAARAVHPQAGRLQFESVTRAGKVLYRLLVQDEQIGVMADASRAASIIRFWQQQGWTK